MCICGMCVGVYMHACMCMCICAWCDVCVEGVCGGVCVGVDVGVNMCGCVSMGVYICGYMLCALYVYMWCDVCVGVWLWVCIHLGGGYVGGCRCQCVGEGVRRGYGSSLEFHCMNMHTYILNDNQYMC